MFPAPGKVNNRVATLSGTMTDPPAAAPEPDAEPVETEAGKVKLTKAEKLEAKAARLREAEQERAARAAERADAGPPAERGRPNVVALAIAAVLVVGLTGVLVWSLWHAHTLSNQKDAANRRLHAAQQKLQSADVGNLALGQSAIAAAKSYALEFGSYDYRHLDADFAKVAAHLTPDFKKSYLESSSRLKAAIEQVHGRAVATVRAAGLVSATTGAAEVAIFLDQKVTTSQSTTPRIDRNRLLVSLVRSGDNWLISKLTSP